MSCARREPERPNLIVVLTDDQGYADLGVQGVANDVKTPHIDALAADGVRFTRGYVTAPQCVPSRAGLLTGRYQTRFGMETNRDGPLPDTEKTIADDLRAAGYVTGMVGKWHLDSGLGAQYGPGPRGFDEYFEGTMLSYQANYDLEGNSLPNAPETIRDERYRIDVQTDAAIAFLERRSANPRQPFFLYLAYFAPHVPLEQPEPYGARFGNVADETRRMGLASIAAMDDGVGRIRQFLREHGMEENTLLFLLSDNGAPIATREVERLSQRSADRREGNATDGGIRVPFVAAWKGVLPRGKVEAASRQRSGCRGHRAGSRRMQTPGPELDGVNLLAVPHRRECGRAARVPLLALALAGRDLRWTLEARVPASRSLAALRPLGGSSRNRRRCRSPPRGDRAPARAPRGLGPQQLPPGLPRELPNDVTGACTTRTSISSEAARPGALRKARTDPATSRQGTRACRDRYGVITARGRQRRPVRWCRSH